MSDFSVKLNIEEFNAWLNKTHRANISNIDAFEAADKDPDTFVIGHYLRNLSDEAKLVVQTREFRQTLKALGCTAIKDIDGTSPCHVFTYVHWRAKNKFGDMTTGRMTSDRSNHKDYSARGVSRNPEIRDYFQQVGREVCEMAEAIAK